MDSQASATSESRGMPDGLVRGGPRSPLPEELQPWFPGLEIVELLGAGGMGAVYKARQPRLNRFVALKILTCPPEHYADFAMRFEREAQVMARMNHPHIVTIFDFGEVDRSAAGLETMFFFLMEFVDGSDLNRLIRSGGMTPVEALAFVPQICEALQFAHDEGITHRDIKPANILVDRKGHVKIADFGLAKLIQGDDTLAMGLTMTGTAMGTPQYMAPEQWEAPEKVDHRADIYSLGVVIYELLTGERPAGVFDPPSKKCKVDRRMDTVVMRAMEKQPERRYQQASQVKSEVTRVIGSAPGLPAMRRRRQVRAGVLVAGLALLVGMAGWFWRPKTIQGSAGMLESATPERSAGTPARTGTEASSATLTEDAGKSARAPLGSATKDAPFANSLGMKFVPVPGTDVLFCIHETRWRDYAAYAGETGSLDSSWRTQSHGDFTIREDSGEHPVVGVSWEDAQDFCAWLSKKEGRTYRLPTDREWSFAVGIGAEEDWKPGTTPTTVSKPQSMFPWGEEWPPPAGAGNYNDESRREKAYLENAQYLDGYDDTFPTTAPVMRFTPNSFGLYDLGGNVWEWCEDWNSEAQEERVLRGGSYFDHERGGMLSSYRYRGTPDLRGSTRGFRVVLEIAKESPPTAAASPTETPSTPFPPGQWVKVLSNQSALDARPELKGKVAMKDGWLDCSLTNSAAVFHPPGFTASNAGVRLTGRLANRPPISFGFVVALRRIMSQPAEDYSYRFQIDALDRSEPYVALGYYDAGARRQDLLEKKLLPTPPKAGDEFRMEFYTIGSRLIGRLNGELLPIVEDKRLSRGTIYLQTLHLMRDIEVINLDGLSEAEALKIAKVEDVVPTIVPVLESAADSPSAAEAPKTVPGERSALPLGKPGRLRAVGTMMNGKAPDLAKLAAYDDIVDVAGSSDRWVALRASGETISSNGFADFKNIRRIARGFGGEYCFIDNSGKIRFIRGLEMELPTVVEESRVVDAACGNSHGVALLESGETVVFGRRYQEAVDDPSIATGVGTPRWPQPPASVLKNVKSVAAINTHAAALHQDGSVSVWGWNGPISWEPETAMKPIIQIVSAQDAIRMLDENGQVWEFSLPRSANLDQPVGFNGKVRRLETQAVRLRDQLWLRKDGTWWGDTNYPPNLELLQAGNLNADTVFALKAGTSASATFGYLLWIEPVESSVLASSSTSPATAGRLRAAGTSADHKPHNLSKFEAYDDFVDVAGGWGGLWVALRKNGETVSSDGKADFTEIAKIAASYSEEYAFITAGGKLVIPPYQEWKLPPDFEKDVVDAALGSEHGIVLMEDGRAVVFGARYERLLGDPTDPMGLGTPRWPMPEARALENVKAVAATATHAATLHEDASLSLWGWEGPVEWRVDPRQRPLRQIRSTESSVWALDEAGQLWRLDLPRNPSPNQPVVITGKPNLIDSGILRMEERSWCRKNSEWATDLTSRNGAEMLKQAGIGVDTVFSLNGGVTDGRVYVSLLWIEPPMENATRDTDLAAPK